MIPVRFDISELVDIYQMRHEDIVEFKKSISHRVAVAITRSITSIAGKELRQTRRQYINSVVLKEVNDGVVEIELFGFLPNAVEQGLSPFDIKTGFQNSPKKHMKIGGGWYLTVPFRHANPSAIGDASTFSGVMPKDIYKQVVSFKTNSKLTKSMLPDQFKVPLTRPAIKMDSTEWEAYKHKHSIYEGMMKEQKSTGHHGHYITFRRVSDNSDDNSWIHKGIKPHRIFDKAVSRTDILYEVDLARDEFFAKLGI